MNFEQNHASQVNLSLFQNIPEHYNESREDLLSTEEKMYYSNTHLAFPHNSNTNLTISTNNMYVPSSESLHNPNQIMESRTSLQTSSILDINHPMNNAVMGSSQWNHAGSNTSLINRAQSSSCIDLTNNNNNNLNNNVLSASKERFLPKYRPAPAYEIAIQQKYKGQQEQQDVSIPNPHLMYENFHHHHHHQQNQQPAKNLHYPDVTQITHHASNNMINTNYVDASDYLSQRLNLLSFNPPIQYPANRLSSTSTPDLALASHRGVFGYRHTGSSPDLLSRTLLHQHQHGYIQSNPHSVLYPYTSIATAGIAGGGGGGMKQRLRHSHSFLPHATYENLNFIDAPTTNNNPQSFFPSSKHIPNNMIYRTASSVQQLADMEYYLHKQQRNHSLNALNLSNSHISEPIYENVPLPINNNASTTTTTTHNNVERKISNNENRPVRPRPRLVHTEPSSIDVVIPSSGNTASNNINMVNANAFNSNNNISNNNGSTKNINDPLNGNEIASANNSNNNRKHFILTTNNDNNGNKISGSAISITNISALNERDHTSAILPTPSSSSSSPFHIENNNMQINKQRQVISSNASTLMNTSGTSSNYTINTTTTADTTDSGISTEMGNKKESKRNKFWAILGKNKSSSSKQKSATLGREKDKNKKDKGRDMSRDMHDNPNHRWSTGLQGRHPLPISTISKEKLCQLLDAKLNDSQLFLEFERIPKRKSNAQYSCALMDENRNKNSDNTCLPMDENRVRLQPTRDNRMGYFNASHISSTVGHKQRFYIAAQSASNTFTANIFWQGVWEADVYLLIQLTDEFVYVPPNSERCSEYGQVRNNKAILSLE